MGKGDHRFIFLSTFAAPFYKALHPEARDGFPVGYVRSRVPQGHVLLIITVLQTCRFFYSSVGDFLGAAGRPASGPQTQASLSAVFLCSRALAKGSQHV